MMKVHDQRITAGMVREHQLERRRRVKSDPVAQQPGARLCQRCVVRAGDDLQRWVLDPLGDLPEILPTALSDPGQAGSGERMPSDRGHGCRCDALLVKPSRDTHFALYAPGLTRLIEVKNELLDEIEGSAAHCPSRVQM